ncbi:GH92 family glycosyl hydrolase [Paramicrobacterium sp. CJ85]|uniref:GH92 family glycosyl hydrolase n=1 Tax=Paramicrobacterium sp. CJ85 TaxID=3445355 RepID=UPI003F5ED89A
MTHDEINVAARQGGPTTAVAARQGAGFSSPEAYLLEQSQTSPTRWVIPELTGHQVAAGDELSWVWFPERSLPTGAEHPNVDDLETFWAATAFTLDLVFDDGTRLSDSALDQYGIPLTPEAQEDARMQWVDQWNRRRVDLTHVAGRRIACVEASLGRTDGPQTRPARGWLDDVRVVPARPRATEPLDLVRTTRGTHSSGTFSRGNNAPLVAVPHGGVFGLPMTDASDARWPYSYAAHNRASDARPALQAFATSHIPSPWMGDRGVFQIMPSPEPVPDTDRTARALAFDHDDERDAPHEYAVSLEHGVTASLTAGEFALGLRFTFSGERGSIILDHHGTVSDTTITLEDDVATVTTLLDDRENTPPQYVHLRVHGALDDKTTIADGRLGGWITVDGTAPVDVLIGVSTVSPEDAVANLHAAGSYDRMRDACREQWRDVLGTLEVEGASHDQLTSLYSGLYRLFLYPNVASETARDGVPRTRSPYGQVLREPIRTSGDEIVEGPYTTTNGFWDTYRTAWPLLALLTPQRAGELASGFVQHFLDGGWTPRWSAPGAEDVMTGTTSDTVFADLLAKRVPGLDLETAYRSALKNATVPASDHRVGRKGMRPGAFRGYVSTETGEGMSWTLDAAINDWALAVMARMLRDRCALESDERERYDAEAEWFARRSLQYRSVFNSEVGFFVGRRPDGSWRVPASDFDPAEWGYDYTETNAWGTMFTVPHDGAGIVRLHGGEEGMRAALTRFFAERETGAADRSGSYGFAIHEMTEARDIRMGMLGMSNQPAHHIPFMPMVAGDHDHSHRVVRECLQRLFVGSDLGQGYPGDEDNGEMSAWYVFATIGLYPLAPATGSYVLVPPSVRRTVLRPSNGEATVIEVAGPSMGPYIASVEIDGEPWTEIALPHEVLTRGSHIVFTLSDEPCGWGSASRPASASEIHGFDAMPVDVLPPEASPLTDDSGETRVELAAGESVEIPVGETTASLYTLTSARVGEFGWTLELLDSGGDAVAVDARTGECFEWAEQTRVFRLAEAVPGGTLRLTASTPLVLTQVELIARD